MKTKPGYLSDALIALAVIACTLVLLAALGAAMTGYRWSQPGRTVHVDFPDVAGIHVHSQVRYAGAPAGEVISLRHLTPEERRQNANPANAVRVTLGLKDEVPPMPGDVAAVLGADTLLSEKFIALSAGTVDAPVLAEGAIIQGTSQPTFDDLIRGGADVFAVLNKMLPAVKAQVDAVLPKLATISESGAKVAGDAQALFTKATQLMDSLILLSGSGREIAGDAKSLIGGANKLLQEHAADLDKTLEELPTVLNKMDALLGKTQGMLTSNEKDLNATIRDLRAVMQDMRVVAVHAKSFTGALAGGRPTRLIWTKNDEEPSESEVEALRGKRPPANGGKRP